MTLVFWGYGFGCVCFYFCLVILFLLTSIERPGVSRVVDRPGIAGCLTDLG